MSTNSAFRGHRACARDPCSGLQCLCGGGRDGSLSTCQPVSTPATAVGSTWDARYESQATVMPARWYIQYHFAPFTMQRMPRGRVQGQIPIPRPQPPPGIAKDPHTRPGPPAAFWPHAQGIGHCRSPMWPHAAAPCHRGRSAEKNIFRKRQAGSYLAPGGKQGPYITLAPPRTPQKVGVFTSPLEAQRYGHLHL